jgi:hypothetical protein
MKISGCKTLSLCMVMVCLGSWGFAGELPSLLNNMNNSQEGPQRREGIQGKLVRITGPTMIIADKELYLVERTVFYDKYMNTIRFEDMMEGDQVMAEYDPSTFILIAVQKTPLNRNHTRPGMKQEQGSTSPPQDKKDERQIKLTDGVYKN